LSHPLGDLGVTYALHLYFIRKPVVNLLFVIVEVFPYLLQLRCYKRKSVEVGVFWGGGSVWVQIWDGRGRHSPTTVGVRKLEWLPFRVVSKHTQCIFVFVAKHACDKQTDRQTDRITTANTALA